MKTSWIALNLFGGFLVLFSYFIYVPKTPSKILWAGITNPLIKKIYGLSMILSAICFLTYFFTSQASQSSYQILTMFFVASFLWTPSLLQKNSTITFFFLSVVSISVLLLILLEKNKIAKYSLFYFFFHVFVLDNLYWGFKNLQIPR